MNITISLSNEELSSLVEAAEMRDDIMNDTCVDLCIESLNLYPRDNFPVFTEAKVRSLREELDGIIKAAIVRDRVIMKLKAAAS